MPVVESVPVTLAEVLEVRGCPLEENELWALLHQSIVAVQNLLLKGHACTNHVPDNLVTPENVLCTSAGLINVGICQPESLVGTKYWCHDLNCDESDVLSDSAIEKVFVFTIGKTVLHAACYGMHESVSQWELSPLLKTVLQAMCQTDPCLRITLSDAQEVCAIHASHFSEATIFTKFISKLHEEVLGYPSENGSTFHPGDQGMLTDEIKKNCDYLRWTGNVPDDLSLYANTLTPDICEAETKMGSANPRDRWRAAVAKITEQRVGKRESDENNHSCLNNGDSCCHSLLKLYDELKERRKVLDLMKLCVNSAPHVVANSEKSSIPSKVVLPKLPNEMILSPQSAPNFAPESFYLIDTEKANEIVQTSLGILKETSHSETDVSWALQCMSNISSYYSDVPQKTYYSIKDIALGKSVPWKDCISQERRMCGPEFILRSLRPHTEITVLGDKVVKGEEKQSLLFHVSVVVLNGERIALSCPRNITTAQVFEAVVQHMYLQDPYLFGLAYFQDGEYLFVEEKQKLSKILDSSAVSDSYQSGDQRMFTLYLRFKFYVEDINIIRNPSSRHLFYLQLRKNVLDEFTHCSIDTAIVLGGLALQSEFGNYSSDDHGSDYFLVEHYMPYRSIKKLSRHVAKEKLQEQHRCLTGISADSAELKFIQEAQKISEYGHNFHKVLQDKRNPLSLAWLAVSSKGVEVFENVCDERRKSQEYSWSRIKRISFTKKYFCLSPKFDSSCGKHVVYKFYTPVPFKSQYLFHLTVAHHRFFVKLKSKTKVSEIYLEDSEPEQSFSGEVCEWPVEIEVEHEIGFDINSNDESMGPSLSKKAKYVGKLKNLQGSVISQAMPFRTVVMKEKLPGTFMFMKPLSLSKYRTNFMQQKLYSCNPVRRSSSAPAEYNKIAPDEENFSGFMVKNGIHEKVSGTMPRTSCRKRQMKMVSLIKDKACGLGLTITCGDTYDSLLHGAFVELIAPGGPADCDGNLSPGDQILAVNGIDVQNDHFLDVADLLQQCSSPVELVIGKPLGKINHNVRSHVFEKIEDKLDEAPCIKVKAWLSDKCSELTDTKVSPGRPLSSAGEDTLSLTSPPIPKPRKKWSEKDCGSVTVSSTFKAAPDLTVETISGQTGQEKNNEKDLKPEMNCSIISEHFFRGKGSIPDIIASQVRNVQSPDSHLQQTSGDWEHLNKGNGESYFDSTEVLNTSSHAYEENTTNEEMASLVTGDIYHVVLDKKDGSLGLNIFQGKDPSCPSQRNIYVHSLILGGAAEIDNRIKPGDKLLEVNGILLEKLSYNDVVNTLRESAQVTHLALERGMPTTSNNVEESLSDTSHSTSAFSVSQTRKEACESAINRRETIQNSQIFSFVVDKSNHSPAANHNEDSSSHLISSDNSVLEDISEKETTHKAEYIIAKNVICETKPKTDNNFQFLAFDKCFNNNMDTSASLPNVMAKNLRNSASPNSLPTSSTDIQCATTGLDSFVECKDVSGSEPSLNQSGINDDSHDISQCNNLSSLLPTSNNSTADYFTCYMDSSSGDTNDDCATETKEQPHNGGLFGNAEGICKSVMYRSTPNLTENGDDKDFHTYLHRNRSTDCLLMSDSVNSSLYDDYLLRDSGSNINQAPKAPLRKKKLKRLEDILNFSDSDNTFNVVIRKSSRGLGLSICGGRNAVRNDLLCQLICIRKLYPLQPALECGKLAIGDVILEVNGTNMIGLSNTEALEVLRSANTTVNLKIFRPSKSLFAPFSSLQDGNWQFPVDSQSSSASSSLSRTEVKLHDDMNSENCGEFEVTLIKREGSLGFTVSRRDSQDGIVLSGIYVKSLIKEPALSDGRIHPGDRIVQVNGTDISSMSHAEAITFLRNAPESVTLKLFRCNPPVSPSYTEEDYPTSKPLRWEAVELLNDRIKHKENETSEKKNKRRLKKCINGGPNNSSSENESTSSSSSSSSSSGQEHIINSCPMDLHGSEESFSGEGPGLQRNQRPKSLDVLNTSDRKQRMSDVVDEGSFHRQASVIVNSTDLKTSTSVDSCDSNPSKKGGKALLKWRGSTLPSEDSIVSDTEIFSSLVSKSDDSNILSDSCTVAEQNTPNLIVESEVYLNETQTLKQPREPWVRTFDVELDRKWYGRLGFSLCDSPPDDGSCRDLLPCASEVKAVHPGSLAARDGRIAIGDRLVEVNSESVLGKSAAEVIDMMRRLTGLTKMVFCRLEDGP